MKRYKVTLQPEERDDLTAMTRTGSHPSQRVLNALVLLNSDEGPNNACRMPGEAVAQVLRVSQRKIDRVKKRFVESGLEAALGGRERHRIYARKTDGDFEARVVALSCTAPPSGATRWSLRLLADRVVELDYIESISYETIRRMLKKTNLSRGGKSNG